MGADVMKTTSLRGIRRIIPSYGSVSTQTISEDAPLRLSDTYDSVGRQVAFRILETQKPEDLAELAEMYLKVWDTSVYEDAVKSQKQANLMHNPMVAFEVGDVLLRRRAKAWEAGMRVRLLWQLGETSQRIAPHVEETACWAVAGTLNPEIMERVFKEWANK